MYQKNIFLNGESNSWFNRNRLAIKNQTSIIDIDEILNYISDQNSILEIGCSNGYRLNYLYEKLSNFNISLYGIDPSNESIEDGKKNYLNLNLEVGTSDLLNYTDNSFDIVIVGFCLYLVDRELIFKTISEIDRVLKQNGFLVITDFEPPFPLKTPYKHLDGVFSYKNNYSNFFTAGSHYSLVRKLNYNHKDLAFDSNFNERVSVSILFKEDMDEIYRYLK